MLTTALAALLLAAAPARDLEDDAVTIATGCREMKQIKATCEASNALRSPSERMNCNPTSPWVKVCSSLKTWTIEANKILTVK